MIILHHYSQRALTQTPEESYIILKLFAKYAGYSAVAVFFFLSGYGLMESEAKKHLNTINFLKKRYWKIFKPVLLVNLIFVPVYYCLGMQQYDGVMNLIAYMLNIKMIDSVLWFVQSLFFLYAYFHIATFVKKKWLTPITVLLFVVLHILVAAKWLNQSYILIALPIFPMGVAYSIYKEKVSDVLRKWMSPIITLVVYCALSFGLRMLSGCVNAPLMQHALDNILLIFILLILNAWLNSEVSYNSRIGKISYEVYLVHNKIIMIAVALTGFVPNVALLIFLSLILAFLLNKLSSFITI